MVAFCKLQQPIYETVFSKAGLITSPVSTMNSSMLSLMLIVLCVTFVVDGKSNR